ncbi:MAG: scyllo-inositol 2-dehydrogenase (NAD(+)) [Phycisphaerae bacterium]|nr:scyllo-inositol 2-dehydrogenase (NAD(+)) [Phycisphaerae bacterium]
MSEALKVAVIGAGKMGGHHARTYAGLPGCRLAAVVDSDRARAEALASQHGCATLTDAGALPRDVAAVSVAVPTAFHEAVATPLIERRVAVLIEKPLASDTASARRIVEAARRCGTLVQVGHSERFNPVVQAMLRMSLRPRFIETHRISPFTFRSADISVVADMMIHDIDIILHLVGQREYKVHAVGVALLGPHADVANARIRFADGTVVNMTASRLALKTERKIRIFAPTGYVAMDYQKRTGIAIRIRDHIDVIKLARERNFDDLSQMQGVDYSSLVKVEPLAVEEGDPLRSEIEAFLASVRTGASPAVTAEDGLAAVEMADRITEAIRDERWELDGA